MIFIYKTQMKEKEEEEERNGDKGA